MGLDTYVNTYGNECKRRFGRRLKKLTLDAGFSCPNRDGTLGRGGCTFCNVQSFNQSDANLGIAAQLASQKLPAAEPGTPYLAYFQAYTSTYGDYEVLQRQYREAVAERDIVGLFVGTRPDCVPDSVLALLASYQQQGLEVWLELGLQSANDDTLRRINRGHGFDAYADAVRRARRHGLKVCTHLILGLPGENHGDFIDTHKKVLGLGVDGLKLHPLHIVSGSTMARQWQAGRLEPVTLEDYAFSAAELIRHTPAQVLFHRVTAYAKRPMLLAPDWCSYRWKGQMAILDSLQALGGQGHYTDTPYRAVSDSCGPG
ncbi:TIGR01212 family radical SAM protein [Shewanella sedimentimangrovi]|uniref:TIGR01212 family radical SAM protein n=1 Tax=Shewanella sedimentimangrovi TaxID=2814293 RepID=A0ABX7R561_9GAMM|nr:TIGR01212 family radical SAM protein [Shewanella sedimentimangrovi]QSX38982.1 TIGR01212 family radical SAM protein [Shewanella sedimentimangrovi]